MEQVCHSYVPFCELLIWYSVRCALISVSLHNLVLVFTVSHWFLVCSYGYRLCSPALIIIPSVIKFWVWFCSLSDIVLFLWYKLLCCPVLLMLFLDNYCVNLGLKDYCEHLLLSQDGAEYGQPWCRASELFYCFCLFVLALAIFLQSVSPGTNCWTFCSTCHPIFHQFSTWRGSSAAQVCAPRCASVGSEPAHCESAALNCAA